MYSYSVLVLLDSSLASLVIGDQQLDIQMAADQLNIIRD